VANTDNLAQASLPCQGEMSRGSPKPVPRELLLRRPNPCFEREDVSLKRRGSRLSETVQKAIIPIVELSLRRRELA